MTTAPDPRPFDVSFIMPCYNEQDVIPYTIPQFVQAFERAGYRLDLVVCDNGSSDRTNEIVRQFAADGLPVTLTRIEVNEGFGNGVLKSIPRCRAPWIGIIPADGQVDADDVARLFDTVRHTDGMVIGKVRRRFRMDGLSRKIVSVIFNVLVRCLWPTLRSLDVNGNPKIIHRDVLNAMDLQSKQWFLDAEIMVKAHYLGVRILEMNVFARMRSNGLSHVHRSTCWEFLTKLAQLRFGTALSEWRGTHPLSRLRPAASRVQADASSR
jgi:glycosyltransferase involved in cell wall biosynthesis